jgi:hypothetical protein
MTTKNETPKDNFNATIGNTLLAVPSLSVGNYLKRKGIVVQIDGRSIFDMWDDNGVIKCGYEPIELTEKWLLNLGFNKEYKDGYIGIDVGNTDFVLTYPKVMGEWQKGYAFEFTAGGLSKFREVRYVHELQNLFRSITGVGLVGNDR